MNNNFPPTSWTLLEAACKENTFGHEAMEKFSEQYYWPVFSFFKVLLINSREDPADHTNAFFLSKVLSRRLLLSVDRKKGLFRHFLKQALRNYCRDVFRKNKRTDDKNVSVDDDNQIVPALKDDPWPRIDAAFHEAWVRSLLQRALDVVAEKCQKNKQEEHYEIFAGRYLNPAPQVKSWTELGAKYGLDQKKARSRAETVARQLQGILLEILIEDTGSAKNAAEECTTLLALLEDAP